MKSSKAQLVAITPQLEPFSKEMRQKLKLNFDVLTDRQNRVASQFGLAFALPQDLRSVYLKFGIDLTRFNGDDSWTLPMPARFVIDPNSTIRSAAADPDYTIRPEPSDTLEALRTLAASPQL
jgi:peroxiredoxin